MLGSKDKTRKFTADMARETLAAHLLSATYNNPGKDTKDFVRRWVYALTPLKFSALSVKDQHIACAEIRKHTALLEFSAFRRSPASSQAQQIQNQHYLFKHLLEKINPSYATREDYQKVVKWLARLQLPKQIAYCEDSGSPYAVIDFAALADEVFQQVHRIKDTTAFDLVTTTPTCGNYFLLFRPPVPESSATPNSTATTQAGPSTDGGNRGHVASILPA